MLLLRGRQVIDDPSHGFYGPFRVGKADLALALLAFRDQLRITERFLHSLPYEFEPRRRYIRRSYQDPAKSVQCAVEIEKPFVLLRQLHGLENRRHVFE